MISKNVTVNLKQGASATPIAMLVQIANRYESSVYIEQDSRRINVKSIMGMMSLNLVNGTSFDIMTEGKDEADAIEAVCSFLTE